VGEPSDRRARKKAQTRDHIRCTAQRLFAQRGFEAVTIADVASGADVAVQTVFNHFATKEELFFSDRTPWREGPAEAVRTRDPDTGPLAALRAHLLSLVEGYMERASTTEHHQLMVTLHASPALLAHERLIYQESEELLRDALLEAWEQPKGEADAFVPQEPRLAASVIAAVWLGAIRALLVEQRNCPPAPGDAAAVKAVLEKAEALLDRAARMLEPAPSEQARDRRAS
jgi:AcrR family transcriptional regulator